MTPEAHPENVKSPAPGRWGTEAELDPLNIWKDSPFGDKCGAPHLLRIGPIP